MRWPAVAADPQAAFLARAPKAKDDKIAQHTFNARAESVAEKPSFRAAFKRRRCLVPVSAFFEWRTIPGEKKKQKLRFSSPEEHPLALAGLWEHWQRPATGEVVESYTVITTGANTFMAPIHDRMPVSSGCSEGYGRTACVRFFWSMPTTLP